jgi:hypothetical protein
MPEARQVARGDATQLRGVPLDIPRATPGAFEPSPYLVSAGNVRLDPGRYDSSFIGRVALVLRAPPPRRACRKAPLALSR